MLTSLTCIKPDALYKTILLVKGNSWLIIFQPRKYVNSFCWKVYSYNRLQFFTNLHKTGPTSLLLRTLHEVISKFLGTDIMTSPGLKYFSAINPRPVSTHTDKKSYNHYICSANAPTTAVHNCITKKYDWTTIYLDSKLRLQWHKQNFKSFNYTEPFDFELIICMGLYKHCASLFVCHAIHITEVTSWYCHFGSQSFGY